MRLNRPLLRSLAVPVLLLLGSLALVQWHSIAFWSHASGVELGWLWSVLIEAAALWLWFLTGRPAQGWAEARRWALRIAAVAATALLLAGPLHQVSRPIWSDAALRERNAAEILELRRENGELERNLAQFRANSAERVGWLGAIEGAQASLGRNQARIRELLGSQSAVSATLPWLGYAVVGMQALALLLFQIVNILAITTVARRLAVANLLSVSERAFRPTPAEMHHSAPLAPETLAPEIPETAEMPKSHSGREGRVAPETAAEIARPSAPIAGAAGASGISEISEPPAPKDVSVSPPKLDLFTLKALRDRVQLALAGGAMTQREFCQAYDLAPADLSSFFALFDREKRSERKPSRKSVERLMALFPPPKEARS